MPPVFLAVPKHQQPFSTDLNKDNDMTQLETLQAELAKLNATIQRIDAESAELRDSVSFAQSELTTARGHLASLQDAAKRKAASVAELGEQLLLVQELEDTAASLTNDAEPKLAKLAVESAKLRDQVVAHQRLCGRAELAALIHEYEAMLRPAWALADQIRDHAARFGVPLEKDGPLLDRQVRCVAGYPLGM